MTGMVVDVVLDFWKRTLAVFSPDRFRRGQTSILALVFLVGAMLIAYSASHIPSQKPYLIFLGVVIFIVAFIKTDLALSILIFSMLLSPEFELGRVSDRAVVVRMDDIFLFVIFIGWLSKLAVYKELGLLKKTALNLPIRLYVIVCVVSTALMILQGEGSLRRAFFYLVKYLEYFLVYFLVVNNVHTMKQVRFFVGLLLITCCLVSVYALYSYFVLGQRATAPFEGLEGEANTLAGYLVFMMALVGGLLLHTPLGPRMRYALFVVLGTSGVALIYTLSRSGWITFAAMALVMLLSAKKQRTTLVVVLAAIVVFFTLASPQIVKDRFSATFKDRGTVYKLGRKKISIDESGSARINAWKLGFEKLAESPLLGHGIPKGSVVDNQYTRVMTETGLLGVVAFGFLLFRIFQVARSAIRQTSQNPYAQGIAIGFLAGYCALLVHGFTAATFIIIRIMEPFWFVAALVVMLPEFVTAGANASPVEIQGT